MGKIYFRNNAIDYDEAEHKSIFQIFKDNNIPMSIVCDGSKPCEMCRLRILYGNIVLNGMVSSLSDTEIQACHTIPLGDIKLEAVIEEPLENEINSDKINKSQYGIAIDIGTTTLVLYFYNIITKEIITIQSEKNKQSAYGTDLFERLDFHCNNEDKGILQRIIINQINEIIISVCNDYDFDYNQITRLVITGNTLMLHLISGIDVSSAATSLLFPMSLFGIEERAMKLGLNVNQKATVYLSQCVCGLIGGDITTGLLACNMDKDTRNILYLDIGTSSKIVLKANDDIYCCVSIASHAFECIGISNGMIAKTGAISSISFDLSGKINATTVNDTTPIGICGAGIIDAIATYLELSKIDENWELKDSDKITISDGIFITQRDINEVKRAKLSVYEGILNIIDYAGITLDNIDEVLIANTFGTKINPSSACQIGLIPKELLNRTKAIGHAAGLGASQILLKPYEIDRLQDLADKCKYIELAEAIHN